jgi:HYR domain
VPGLEFDVTAPMLHGAGSKTVRAQRGAKRARVTFKVTSTDGVDGAVPVSCQPRSGRRFPLGKTIVRCAATDSIGNTATAGFTVTAKRRR